MTTARSVTVTFSLDAREFTAAVSRVRASLHDCTMHLRYGHWADLHRRTMARLADNEQRRH